MILIDASFAIAFLFRCRHYAAADAAIFFSPPPCFIFHVYYAVSPAGPPPMFLTPRWFRRHALSFAISSHYAIDAFHCRLSPLLLLPPLRFRRFRHYAAFTPHAAAADHYCRR